MNNSQDDTSKKKQERWAIIGPICSGKSTFASHMVREKMVKSRYSIEDKALEVMNVLNVEHRPSIVIEKFNIKQIVDSIRGTNPPIWLHAILKDNIAKGKESLVIEDCTYSDLATLSSLKIKIIILIPSNQVWTQMVEKAYTFKDYKLAREMANLERYFQWCGSVATYSLDNTAMIRLNVLGEDENLLLLGNAVTHLKQDSTPVVW